MFKPSSRTRALLIWIGLLAVILVPLIASAMSPLLAWRRPAYIIAGFSGVIAMCLLLLQPLLAGGLLPGLSLLRARRVHLWTGIALVGAVLVHVGGLWITSPPDAIDALLLRAPTAFSYWGVVAMWALFIAALLVALKPRLPLRLPTWRLLHRALAVVIVIGSVIHAWLIEGTMEPVSKAVLCLLTLAATIKAVAALRIWRRPGRGKKARQ
ncbi:Ferric reductase like transmembrane component [Cohaesibacter sp. ES.047]|uniref:ferric reductase-like transmembrane domain-containing protein n=1 Tax=Cohaesibacter sp. ES.047 TaxID=1798205 RepID=UPI000BB9A375|nr:ferric reductase-like transmembrane domain-containing protein [Cohaesibacter sp. ES.047]SNY92562.1 Ferric reductase like transmembrane component [Cohaesibacter sp. ES.047]